MLHRTMPLPDPERTVTETIGAPAPARPEAVRLVGVSKAYGRDLRQLAVRDLHLTVPAGDFMTLLGPSGSGKTTTLMMIAGFEQPSRGDIFIDGARVTEVPAHRRDLSMVFQSYALFPHRTVARNIAFALEMRRRPRAEIAERVRQALAMVRLSGFEDRLPHQLSGGQQQRVALARAIVFTPRVLLMDEPLGALDKNLREEMQSEIKEIQRRLRVTVIYVTHDQQEALTMSDHIAVMSDGRVEQIGAPGELYDRPRNRFVAGFLGESNFIEGVVKKAVGQGGRVQVETPAGQALIAMADRPLAAGTTVAVAIRPERIRIASPGASPLAGNAWPGTVKDVLFVGETLKYKVAACFGTLAVKVQNDARCPAFAPGDPVLVGWEPADARLLAE